MKRLILLLFICIAYNANAQKIRFTDTSNKWNYANLSNNPSDPWANFYSRCSFVGDTIINTLQYLKTQHSWIREDTIAHKVYYMDFNDSIEKVLYDFSLQPGDTAYIQNNTFDTLVCTVDSIDSVMIDGIAHGVWHTSTKVFGGFSKVPSNFAFIEGVGSSKGVYYPTILYEFENIWTLSCFENKGIRPVFSKQIGYFNNTTSCKLSVNEVSMKQATVFPNPITPESKIVLPANINSGTVTIYNSLGQVIKEQRLDNFREIYIGSINNPGIYFYRILDSKSQSVYAGQFMSH